MEKLLKLVAESDSLTEIGSSYIHYLYFRDILFTFIIIVLICGGWYISKDFWED